MVTQKGDSYPYIGVAGIMTVDELNAIARAYAALNPQRRALFAGILLSSKSVNGIRNKYPERYPSLDAIFQLIKPSKNIGPECEVKTVLHYASDDQATYAFQILGIKKYFDWLFTSFHMNGWANAPITGFQLNAIWPNLQIFKDLDFAAHFGEYFRVILQIGPQALRLNGPDPLTPAELVATLTPYIGTVSNILIDSSCGRGAPLPIQRVTEYLDAIHQAQLPFDIGVAGGLDATTINQLQSLFETYPNLSIDAEGLLRDPLTDKMDLNKVRAYMTRAHQLLDT